MLATFDEAHRLAYSLACSDQGRQQTWCVVALPYGWWAVHRLDAVPPLARLAGGVYSRCPGQSSWTPGRGA